MAGCRPLSEDEIEAMKESLDQMRDRLLFTLGVKCGFRISELLSLNIKDVIENDDVTERVTVSRRNMKGKLFSRSVILTDEARAAIAEYINSLETWTRDQPLFKSRQGDNQPISRIRAGAIMRRAKAEAGINGPVATHSMRKTFAETVYKLSGHNLLLTKEALGHTSAQNTEKYLAVAQKDVDAIIRKMK
jgi:integrase